MGKHDWKRLSPTKDVRVISTSRSRPIQFILHYCVPHRQVATSASILFIYAFAVENFVIDKIQKVGSVNLILLVKALQCSFDLSRGERTAIYGFLLI